MRYLVHIYCIDFGKVWMFAGIFSCTPSFSPEINKVYLILSYLILPKNVPRLFALDQTNDGSIALHGLIETVLSHCLRQVPALPLCREKVKKALRDIAID